MVLPPVNGWIIDFRTAEAIFSSGSNIRINHCQDLCQAGQMHICHCEEKLFQASASLKAPFLTTQSCIYEPDEDICQQCITISANPIYSKVLSGNDTALYITAIAISKTFGVISDHRSIKFATVFDLCNSYGVPVFSANDYFGAL